MTDQSDHPAPPPKEVHFKVDNEPFTTTGPNVTPNIIIAKYGEKDPATNYLILIKGKETVTYKDKGGDPITIENGDKFQCVSLGPTPVSDPGMQFGTGPFLAGLKDLGFDANVVEGYPDRITFLYSVDSGKYAGQSFEIGLSVPHDFPAQPPTGPHVHAHVVPINPGAPKHPQRAHDSFFGSEWQYWSRPVLNWARDPSVRAYMGHLFHLWHTQ